MYVCICNGITESQVREAIGQGASDLWRLQAELGVASCCGSCRTTASEILAESRAAKRAEPVLYVPSIA